MNRNFRPFRAMAGAGAMALVAFAAALGANAQDAEPTLSVLDGVYTEEQAERGLDAYISNGCSGCHAVEMEGSPGGPTLTGFLFSYHWGGKSADEVLTFMRENMPPGQAGSLTDEAYTDVLAAIFSANGYPAGDEELTPDMLDTVLVEALP